MSENRRNSFSEADETALRQIQQPLRMTVYLSPEDPRLTDLDRSILSKLRRILARVDVTYAASGRTGLFEDAGNHYGEIWYEIAGRQVMSRSTTEAIVLEQLYELAGVNPPERMEDDFPGYPLAARPRGASWIFYAVLKAVLRTPTFWKQRQTAQSAIHLERRRKMHRLNLPAVRKATSYLMIAVFMSLCSAGAALARDGLSVTGMVRDSSGAAISEASVSLVSAQQATVGAAKTDSQGRFSISNVPAGHYLLVIRSRGFANWQQAVTVVQDEPDLEVTLDPAALVEEVTVTTNPGVVESTETISQQVNVINEQQIEQRARSVVAQVANEEVGVHLQRTSPTVSGIFIRGLTGNKVNVFIDGVRYSNAAQRGGVSSFFNLIDQTNLHAVEILRGPNSAQYGSDAIGGSIQFLTYTPAFATGSDTDIRGKFGASFNSADAGFGSNLLTTFATKKLALLTNVTGRRVNTLRTGHGRDSHNAVTRFFALPSDLVIDGRMPDTAFTQYGGLIKMDYQFAPGSQLTLNYARSQSGF